MCQEGLNVVASVVMLLLGSSRNADVGRFEH